MGSHDRDQFDDLFDGALKQYGRVEPRAGLEDRVLARLATVDRQPHRWGHWPWGFAIAGSVFVVIALVILISTSGSHVVVHQPDRNVSGSVAHEGPPIHSDPVRTVRTRPKRRPELVAAQRPKEFPSPHALSEQERLLKSYVSNFPQEAALVAHEQAEREKELAAMGWDSTVVPDSN